LGDNTTIEDIDLGGNNNDTVSIIGKINKSVAVSGTVEFGDATANISKIYVNGIRSDNVSLTLETTGIQSNIEFKPHGIPVSGVTSANFFLGDRSTTSYYTLPITTPASVNNQVLAYTASNSLTFTSATDTDSQTLQQVTAQGTTTTDAIQIGGLTVSGTTRVTIGVNTTPGYYTLPLGTDPRASNNVLTVSTTANTLYFAPITYVETQGLSDVTSI